MAVTFTGMEKVLKNLNREIRKIEGETIAGLMEAGEMIRAKAGAYTPVDTGNLINSAYVRSVTKGLTPVVEIGYTASYAVFVHEIDKHYRKPGSSWKYLEKALMENKARILQIIANRTRV